MSVNEINEMQVVCGGGGSATKRVHLTNANKIAKIQQTICNGDIEFLETRSKFEKNMQSMENQEINIRKLKEKLKRETLKYKRTKKETVKIYEKLHKWSRVNLNCARNGHDIGKKADLQEEIQILKTKDSIEKSNREFAVVAKANQKRMAKNTILADISKLPEVIVDHIRGYIPYEIRNEMIEQTYKPVRKLIPKLDKIGLCEMIKRIYLEPTFFSTLSPSRVEENTQGQFAYKPEWRFDKKGNMKVRLLNAIVELKRSHPELLYKVFPLLLFLLNQIKNT